MRGQPLLHGRGSAGGSACPTAARRGLRQRGSIMVEFALAGVASTVMLIATVQLAIGMWKYHTLAYAVHEGTRYVSVKGVGCTKIGYSCSVTVADIATHLKTLATGLPDSSFSVTLKTDSGVETSCSPLSSCSTNLTVWPPSTNLDNRVAKKITI